MAETSVAEKVREDISKERTGGSMEPVKLATDLIKGQFGHLDDLPNEMANSIVNIFYGISGKFIEMMDSFGKKALIAQPVKRRIMKDLGPMFVKFLTEEAQLLKDLETGLAQVKGLRGINKPDRLPEPNVELILENLESNSGNVQGKTVIQQPR
jgi:hypothetical protein